MNARMTTQDFGDLFSNSDPDTVWHKASLLVALISPKYDSRKVHQTFVDVVRLFRGDYPGYCPIRTPYHNLPHTLDVFMCSARLMHGMHISGIPLNDRDLDLVLMAALLHDIGYAQLRDGSECGTGAQFTPVHIQRGLDFARTYIHEHSLPASYITDLAPIISCSDPMLHISRITFPNENIHMLGQILGTADLVGQMADRLYLEKLLLLYEEFEEANLQLFGNVFDMMRKTREFHDRIKKKLDEEFNTLYRMLQEHFKATLDQDRNFYMESIQKNIEYLTRIANLDEQECLRHLRRGGIVKDFLALHPQK